MVFAVDAAFAKRPPDRALPIRVVLIACPIRAPHMIARRAATPPTPILATVRATVRPMLKALSLFASDRPT